MKHDTKANTGNSQLSDDRDFALIDEHGFFHESKIPLSLISTSQPYPPFPEPLLNFIFRFETACVVDCCGVDAFQFSPSKRGDARWKSDLTLENLLNEEITKVENFPAQVLTVFALNQKFLKEDFLLLLKYLADGLIKYRHHG